MSAKGYTCRKEKSVLASAGARHGNPAQLELRRDCEGRDNVRGGDRVAGSIAGHWLVLHFPDSFGIPIWNHNCP
jgi:hypothetical protein